MSARWAAAALVALLVLASGALAGTATTVRESVSSTGEQGDYSSSCYQASTSADGRLIAFQSYATNLVPDDTNGFWDVFVHDQAAGTTVRASVSTSGNQANDDVFSPALSRDGRYATFDSYASNLVPGDTNGATDAFLHDLQAGTTERVSVSSTGAQGDDLSWSPVPSGNGRLVALTLSPPIWSRVPPTMNSCTSGTA